MAKVMLTSLLLNNKESIVLYVLTDDVTEEDIKEMKQFLCDISLIDIHIINIPDSYKNFLVQEKLGRWPIQVYYRLFAPWLLPIEEDRALYLDADMIVDGDISDLYNINLDSFCFAACEDKHVANNLVKNQAFYNRLCLSNTAMYYNSGLILMNLKEIRKRFSLNDIKILIESDKYSLVYPDQDVFNILASDQCKTINYRVYNLICIWDRQTKEDYQKILEGTRIYHFGGESIHKPWEYVYIGDFRDVFWKYAERTKSKEARRRFYIINNLYRLYYCPRIKIYDPFIRKLKSKIKKVLGYER